MKLTGTAFGALILSVAFCCSAVFAAGGGKKLYGELDQWAAVCNTAGIKLKGAQVDKVMLGTPAYFSGLRAGDKLLNCNVGSKSMQITFQRDGKPYGVVVPIDPSAVQPGVEAPIEPKAKFALGEQQAIQMMRDFDVIVFLDCSGSMSEGIRSEGVRKWDWASKQIRDFNTKYNEVVKRPITLVTFNDKFHIFPNCTPKDLEDMFAHREPEGGTDLAQPLQSILNDRLRELEKRPCVIVVLHDGISDNEQEVQRILERTAEHLFSPGKIFITFIQIGDDQVGSENLKQMEAVNFGGKDLVKAELFDEVRENGLAKAIAQAIKQHIPVVSKPVAPAPAKPKIK